MTDNNTPTVTSSQPASGNACGASQECLGSYVFAFITVIVQERCCIVVLLPAVLTETEGLLADAESSHIVCKPHQGGRQSVKSWGKTSRSIREDLPLPLLLLWCASQWWVVMSVERFHHTSMQDVSDALAHSEAKCLFPGDKDDQQRSVFTPDSCHSGLLHLNDWVLLPLQRNICSHIYAFVMKRIRQSGNGGGITYISSDTTKTKPTKLNMQLSSRGLILWPRQCLTFSVLSSHHLPPLFPAHFWLLPGLSQQTLRDWSWMVLPAKQTS